MTFRAPALGDDPLALFVDWYATAERVGVVQPDAVALATTSAEGRPSVRMVLYKGLSDSRPRFFTNHESRKAVELEGNPFCALVFHWKEVARQVRIEGRVERLPETEADEYFASRPRESQIGAIVSPQSRRIESHDGLMAEFRRLEEQAEGSTLPRPTHWGGYAVDVHAWEFWVAQEARLHERVAYTKGSNGLWSAHRVAP